MVASMIEIKIKNPSYGFGKSGSTTGFIYFPVLS